MEHSVAVGGRYAVVGVPWHDRFKGAAYVLERNGNAWREVQMLSPDDLGPHDHFGLSVSVDGDNIRVEAPWQNLFRGAVYVFRRSGDRWALHEKLDGTGPPPGRAPPPAARTSARVSAEEGAAIDVVRMTSGPAPEVRPAGGTAVEWVNATDAAFEDRVEVKWAPVELDAILYKVLRDGALVGVASSDDSLYDDQTGARGVTYSYCVVVMDMAGGEGPPTCDPGSRVIRAPERLAASDGQFVDGVHLTWEDRSSVEAGFRVRRDGVQIATLDPNRRSYVDATSVPLAVSTYEVVAFDSDGNLSTGASDPGFRGVVLPPLEVSATDGEFATSVRVRWVDQGGGVGFVVTRRDLAATEPVALDTTAAGAVEYVDPTAVAGVRYQYCVSTLDSLGRLSVPACDEGDVDLAPPLNVAASDSTFDDRIQVTWEDRSGLADGYFIRRDGIPIDTVAASKRTFNDFDATPDATHTYCVVAFSDDGGASIAGCDDGFRMFVLAPTGVTATDGDFEDRTQIRWGSSSTTVALFKILRDGVPIKTVGPGSRAYADDGGTAGREYVYGVQAVTGQLRTSATSADAGRRELRPPINVAATDDAFEDRVEITWRDVSAHETGFVIYRLSGQGAAPDSIGQTTTGTTSYTDRIGAPGVRYRYSVAAFDVKGEAQGESEPSTEDEGLRTLLRPTAVGATDGAFEDRVEITWKDHSNVEDGYRVYRDGAEIAATTDNVTSVFDLNPPFGIASEYSVRAFDAYGTSLADEDAGSTTLLAPGSFNASDSYGDRIVLRWVDVSEVEAGYTVLVDSAGVTLRTITTPAGATSLADAKAVAGVTYEYRIRAFAGAAVSSEARDTGVRPLEATDVPTVALDTTLVRAKETSGRISPDTDGLANDFFGWAAAVSGNVIIVGSPGDNPRGGNSGSAYAFERGPDLTWKQKDNFWAAQDGQGGDRFGEAVAIDGNRAIVGMPRRQQQYGSFGNYSGLALMFNRNPDGTWNEGEVLSPLGEPINGDPQNPSDLDDRFGQAVAISENMWMIGAPADNLGLFQNQNVDFGAVYFYTQGQGTPTKFFASDATTRDSLGAAVAILGDWAAAGAPGRDDRGNHSGAVYVFKRFIQPFGRYDWSQHVKLTASDGSAGAAFGRSVLRVGDRIIVGAPRDVGMGSGPGAVYVFALDPEDGAWKEEAILRGSFTGTDRFGASIAMWNNWLIVGAPGEGPGAAYVFLRDPRGTWSAPSRIVANGGAANDLFGEAVAVGNEWAFAGARADDVVSGAGSTLADAGSVYSLLVLGTVTDVVASDGTASDRVHIEWHDRSASEEGHIIYRDGVEYDRLGPNEDFYDDVNAEPGRAYEYAVAAISSHAALPSQRASDFGWRPPNGAISGKITNRLGDGVSGVSVCLEPRPARALLFDGVGGHVEIPDDGAFNFTSGEDFTIEAWFRYAGSDRTPRIISKLAEQGIGERPIDMGLQRSGRLFFTMSDGVNVARVLTTRSDLAGDRWHHVACVHVAGTRTLILYVDGVPEDSVSTQSLGNVTNLSNVFLGGFGADTWYGGQLDELRIWDVPRSLTEIQAARGAPLAGGESGLVGYWPMDEVSGLTITDFAGVAQYGSFVGGVYRTDQVAPIEFCVSTDAEGAFVIHQVRYEENGSDFKLRPALENRRFSPAVQPVTLNRDHPVENQIAFSDISSHDLSGVVRFAGTNCFEPDVEIVVDNAAAGVTDRNGKFSVTLVEGVHTIRAQHRGHSYRAAFQGDTLSADSITINVRAEVRDLVFLNDTRRPVSGRVGGGCDRSVGEVTLRFRSENNCLDTTFVGNPAYTIQLPPMRYLASATIDRETIPASLVRPDVVAFFENLGERPVNLLADTDSTVIDDTLDFVYRAPLRVAVTGLEPYINPACPQLTLEDGTVLPAGLPVIPQGKAFEVTIRVEEVYGDTTCPLDTGLVVIVDEFAERQDAPDTLTISGGIARYQTVAATPSLVRGRTEGRTDRSFQKALVAKAVVEGRAPVARTEWALVTGHVAPQGAEFVTSPSTEIPMLVLRDPPGDGSYAYWEDGSTICTRLDWTSVMLSGGAGVSHEIKMGATTDTWVGFGAGISQVIASHFWSEGKLLAGLRRTDETTVDLCVTTTERMSTSPSADFVAGDADLYVGIGITFLFAEVGVIALNGCRVEQSTAVGFEADSIHTAYAFTEQHIRDILIPELESKVAYYQAQGDADSAQVFGDMRDAWQHQLDFNRSDKQARGDTVVVEVPGLPLFNETRVTPRPKTNRSFSAGADYSFAAQSEHKISRTLQTFGYVKGELGLGLEAGPEKKFHFKVGIRAEGERNNLRNWVRDDTTTRSVVGFVLSDGDPGDNYTVDIVRPGDGGFIFDVLGGRSSCPYEPWPDLGSGQVSMVPRDEPRLFLSPPQRFGVAPDTPALFKLTVANQSDEARDYFVRLLSNSNPGGAIIHLNGSPISDRPVFSIDGAGAGHVNAHEATLSVERGPSRFNYADLKLVVEPVCGDAAVADTLSFSVAYEGCSDIRLSGPDVTPGWTYSHADSVAGKELDLVLSGYELIVDPATPNLVEAVGIQFRHMGDGREGPGPWTDIRESPPGIVADFSMDGSPDTILVWRPDSLANGGYKPLVDGIYEVRVYTVCSAGGRGYSDASRGTIDRHAPLVFGTPHPSDRELSLGEDIGFTFNEPLDCEALGSAVVTLRYVDGPQAGQSIPVTLTCNGETILLIPKVDGAVLDGRRLEASVAGVRDRVGNPMTTTATWQFDYRRNLFTWSETRIARDVALASPGKVSATLANGTDQAVDYEVTSLPAFLSMAPSQARGRLAPAGTRTVEFDIDPQIAGGIHQGRVEMHATNTAGGKVAVATLDVVLDVSCAAPVWAIDPSRFEYSMSVVARVQVTGGPLTGASDLVAAFVGDQLRGVARPRDVAGDTLVFLTVFSNRTTGETARFEVWDDDQCRRYGSTAERAPFGADVVLGTTIAPFILTAQDAPPGSVASFPLQAGWNWFSTNVNSADMSPSAVLASLAPAAGDVIKSKTAFAVFDPDTSIGWVGMLTTLNNTSGYMIRLTEAGTVLHEGSFADPGATPVPVANGWNWIGYLPAAGMSVGTALADLVTRGFLNGDEVLKGQGSFSEWNSGWFGTLETMAPGEGYRLKLNDPALPSSFNYPTGAPVLVALRTGEGGPTRAVRGDFTRPGESARPNPAAAAEPDAVRAEPPATNAARWPLDPGRFEHNMTLIAHLQGGGVDWGSPENLLGAFVGDECRGVVPLMHVPRLDRHLAFATVHSNTLDGETVRFRAYHAATGTIHDVTETVVFHADAPAGTIREPIALTAGRARGALPVAFRLAEARPNPFTQGTEIHFELPEPRRVVLKVYNVAGQEVCTLTDGHYPAGVHDVRWEARTQRGDPAPNGVYFYRIQAGKFVETRRVVLVR